jgi:release factor glutamine methyltransferase
MNDGSPTGAAAEQTGQPPRTVLEVLNAAAGYLSGRRIEESRMICELLLARLLKCKRLELPQHHGQLLPGPQTEALRRAIKRIAAGEPVQYVMGQTEFMGHVFKTDPRALIPRPETELLVEAALGCVDLWKNGKPLIVDVGTGSGCIAISLALAREEILVAALDISEECLALARENAAALGVEAKIAFFHGELTDLAEPQSVDAVISNPPYVATSAWEKLPVHIRDREPRLALDGGPRGLDAIENLVQDASMALKPGGFLFMEIGYDQGETVRRLMEECDFKEVLIRRDLAGLDRIAVGRMPA